MRELLISLKNDFAYLFPNNDTVIPAEQDIKFWNAVENACIDNSEIKHQKSFDREYLLHAGQAALYSFIIANWTGPFNDSFQKNLQKCFQKNTLEHLLVDGELPSLVLFPSLLSCSLYILSLFDHDDAILWKVRAMFIHQRILPRPVAHIKDEIYKYLNLLSYIERALVYLYYHHFHQESDIIEIFDKVEQDACLNWHLTGVLGRRTKYQDRDIAQLVVSSNGHETTETGSIPITLPLNDNVLLEQMKPTNEFDNNANNGPILHCILLANCLKKKYFTPKDQIQKEEMEAILSRILEKSSNWSIYTLGLLLRSEIELEYTRKAERSILQMQALVDQISIDGSWIDRVEYFWNILLPSRWQLERSLAMGYARLGVILTALSIFEKLQSWKDVIECCVAAGKKQQAKDLINNQLLIHPDDPSLYCIMGDLSNDIEWYIKSWNISGHRYAQAQRQLGKYYFHHGNLDQSITSLELALEINPLFDSIWLLLGCACMKLSRWEDALNAFTRVVSIDPLNGLAWNNIASIHMMQQNMKEAQIAIQHASRYLFDDWKVWENALRIAIYLNDMGDALFAMNRIFSTNNDIDAPFKLLEPLTKMAIGQQKYYSSLIEIFTTIESRYSNYIEYWKLLIKVHSGVGNIKDQSNTLSKLYRCLINKDYITDSHIFGDLVDVVIHISSLDHANNHRIMMESILKRTEKTFFDHPSYSKLQNYAKSY